MRQSKPSSGEPIAKDIKRESRKQYKTRIVSDSLRGIGMAQGLYYM